MGTVPAPDITVSLEDDSDPFLLVEGKDPGTRHAPEENSLTQDTSAH